MADPAQDINVSVDAEHMAEVVARLREAGMEVTEALELAGVVTGRAPQSRLADLERLEGVHAVEASRRIDLPPPDSPIQ